MNFSIIFLRIFILYAVNTVVVANIGLIAITNAPQIFIHKLYLEERNQDPPSRLDPLAVDPSERLRICEEVSGSGVFEQYGYVPANMDRMIAYELEHPKYHAILYQIYKQETRKLGIRKNPTRKSGTLHYKYKNTYSDWLFHFSTFAENNLSEHSFYINEYVFLCLLRRKNVNVLNIVPYFVSKAYNVVSSPRHFILMNRHFANQLITKMMLVEAPANVYSLPYFNVEIHYLELRKYHQPAPRAEDDPVCKIESEQSSRLCSIVLSSNYFTDKISHPYSVNTIPCNKRKISFRTEEVMTDTVEKSYYEWMLGCHASETGYEMLFISRAYNPNHVFVFTQEEDSPNAGIYVELLSTHVRIIHELFNFDEIEI